MRKIAYVLSLSATLPYVLSCSNEQLDNSEEKYALEVENCVCRELAFEEDNFRRVSYPTMVQTCNKTVLSSNPVRFSQEFHADPKLDTLRCTDDVEDWQEVVEEESTLQASNRKHYQDFKNTTKMKEDSSRD